MLAYFRYFNNPLALFLIDKFINDQLLDLVD